MRDQLLAEPLGVLGATNSNNQLTESRGGYALRHKLKDKGKKQENTKKGDVILTRGRKSW